MGEHRQGASFFGGFRNARESEREFSLALDVERRLDWGPIESVEAGAVYRDKTQSRDQSLAGLLGARLNNLNNSFYGKNSFANGKPFMNGQLGGFDPADYAELDVRALTGALTPVTITTLPSDLYFIGPEGLVNFLDTSALQVIYDNEQKITGGYGLVNFEQQLTPLVTVRGNAGLRYEKSERSTVAARQPEVLAFEYENTLPSVNVIFDVGDNFLIRASYTETLRRPQVDSFAVLRSLAVDGSGGFVTANLGATDLLPFTSTNYDLSAEWYNRRGSSVSALLFKKEVADYAGSTRICPADGGDFGLGPLSIATGTCRTTQPTPARGTFPAVIAGATVNINVTANQDNFTLEGFELSAQQNLDFLPAPWNGFGGQVNYTNVSFSTDSAFRLNEISEHTFNAILYYEVPLFSVRAAYNWRSEYFIGAAGTAFGADRFVDARPQLDLSGSININDRLSLSAEAFNVTNEDLYEYEGVTTRARNYIHYGRTYTVGLRYRFQ